MEKIVLIVMAPVAFAITAVLAHMVKEHFDRSPARLFLYGIILSAYSWMSFLPFWAVFFTGPAALFLSLVKPWRFRWMLPAACAAGLLLACLAPSETEAMENALTERERAMQEAVDALKEIGGGSAAIPEGFAE